MIVKSSKTTTLMKTTYKLQQECIVKKKTPPPPPPKKTKNKNPIPTREPHCINGKNPNNNVHYHSIPHFWMQDSETKGTSTGKGSEVNVNVQ